MSRKLHIGGREERQGLLASLKQWPRAHQSLGVLHLLVPDLEILAIRVGLAGFDDPQRVQRHGQCRGTNDTVVSCTPIRLTFNAYKPAAAAAA